MGGLGGPRACWGGAERLLAPLIVADEVPRLRVRRISGAFSLSELLRLVLLLSVSSASE